MMQDEHPISGQRIIMGYLYDHVDYVFRGEELGKAL